MMMADKKGEMMDGMMAQMMAVLLGRQKVEM